MKPNIADKVVDRIIERGQRVKARLTEQYKATKPFRQEPMSNDELLYYYSQLTPEKMDEMINTYGRENVNQMIYEMETLKQRRKM